MKDRVKKRRYVSPLREESQRKTHAKILDAAHALFVANGYVATSIRKIAAQADVAEQTVYSAFADKLSILLAVIMRVLASDEEATSLEASDVVRNLRAESDPRARLRLAMEWARRTYEHGVYELEAVILEAADSAPGARGLRDEVLNRRLDTHRLLVGLILEGVRIKGGLSLDDAAAFIDAVDSAAVFKTLTSDRGWSIEKYTQWMTLLFDRVFLSAGDP